jgi:hypothetical protein
MAKRRVAKRKKVQKYSSATGWFLAILIISGVAAFIEIDPVILGYVLAIAGAIIAIVNIRIAEEKSYLRGIAVLILVDIFFNMSGSVTGQILQFINNLAFAFGVAGFIIALAVIFKVGIDI